MSFAVKIKKSFNELVWSIGHTYRSQPNIVIYMIYGLLYDSFINLYKPFAQKFLLRLGGDEFYISLYNSLPGMIAIFTILPGSILVSKFADKKKIASILMLIGRFMVLALSFIPMMQANLRPLMFVLLISLMNFPESIFQTTFTSFMGDVFSGKQRGQAISLRNKSAQVLAPIVTFVTGFIISTFPSSDASVLRFYQVFFVLAFLFGLAECFVFNKFKPRPELAAVKSDINLRASLKTVFGDRKFMAFLLSTTVFYFSWVAGWSIATVYQIINLGADEIWLAVFSVASCAGSFFSAGYWQKLNAKKGANFTLIIAVFAMAFNMLLNALAPNLIVFTIVCIYSGVSVIGINTTFFNALLEATPDENRVVFIGVFHTVNNVFLALAPFFSLFLMRVMPVREAMVVVWMCRMLGGVVLVLFEWARRRRMKSERSA